MEMMPTYLVFLHSMPETAILVSLGLVLIGIKPALTRILLVAFFTSLASYFIRTLPLSPGINVFLQLPILIILLAYICRLPVTYAVITSFVGLISLGITETMLNFIIYALTGISIQQALSNDLWRILFPLPEFLILVAIILVLIRYDITIFDIYGVLETERTIGNEDKQYK
ncbi:MAG: hypothetical protein CVU90_10205 [Firmicutes bacterium HGW-Firmicutes-15]|nr:MAG: hypothetical protein CVU90_10205 [Firmicutes bacterium HGW-Firmicutes-15]